jgi:hypothetical protein
MLFGWFIVSVLLSAFALPVAPDKEPVVAEQYFDTEYDVMDYAAPSGDFHHLLCVQQSDLELLSGMFF